MLQETTWQSIKTEKRSIAGKSVCSLENDKEKNVLLDKMKIKKKIQNICKKKYTNIKIVSIVGSLSNTARVPELQ